MALNEQIMKRRIYDLCAFIALFTFTLASCSDDELQKTPLPSISITEGARTVSTLAFSWDPVKGATQYAYELREADGQLVLGDITSATSLIATGLKDNTTYTLGVWAYASVSGPMTTSPVTTITATTDRILPLDTPVPEAVVDNGMVIITWPAVEHAAYYAYQYTVDGSEVNGTTETNTLVISNLPVGEYTVYIKAVSEDEAYSDSESISLTFRRTKAEMWRVQGTYYSASGEVYAPELVAYDDGSYCLESFYGTLGADLVFSVGEEEVVNILNAYGENNGYSYVATGNGAYLAAYTADGYSSFSGTRLAGELWFWAYVYDADGNLVGSDSDYFVWGDTQDEMTVEDLCGEYSAHSQFFDYYIFHESSGDNDIVADVTLTRTDEQTVLISNLFGGGETFTATVDLESRTLTIQPVSIWDWYVFADVGDEDKPVVGTFDETFTITFSGWSAWYSGYTYIEEGAVTTLTRK